MKFTATVVPVGRGQYGPFDDGRTIEYLSLGTPDGGDPERATFAQNVTFDGELYKPFDAELEVYRGDGKLKLRFHGVAKPAAQIKAA